jgi:hypothetical protein
VDEGVGDHICLFAGREDARTVVNMRCKTFPRCWSIFLEDSNRAGDEKYPLVVVGRAVLLSRAWFNTTVGP